MNEKELKKRSLLLAIIYLLNSIFGATSCTSSSSTTLGMISSSSFFSVFLGVGIFDTKPLRTASAKQPRIRTIINGITDDVIV